MDATNDFRLSDGTVVHVSKDGNKWCALIGTNLQDGVASFGDSKAEALFSLAYHLKGLAAFIIGKGNEELGRSTES